MYIHILEFCEKFSNTVLGTKVTFRFYDLEKHGNAGSRRNKVYKKANWFQHWKQKKREQRRGKLSLSHIVMKYA